jgi:hypothetical protein
MGFFLLSVVQKRLRRLCDRNKTNIDSGARAGTNSLLPAWKL